jgi:anti-sigma B factor antagonist
MRDSGSFEASRDPGEDAAIGRSLRPRGPVRLNLTEREAPEATVLTVRGEVDILTSQKLTAQLDDIVRRHSTDAVIDLREAEFIDSVGLYILLNAQRRLRRQSRALAVICGPGAVRRTIELTRLTETLGVVSSFEEYLGNRPAA